MLLHLARHRGIDEAPFLYGTVFMSNAASLFLPGSNLTNLIVLHHEHVAGATFLARMWPAAIASVVATAAIMIVVYRRALDAPAVRDSRAADDAPRSGRRRGGGVRRCSCSSSHRPPCPCSIVGVVVVVLARTTRARLLAAVDPRVIGGLFVLAVAVGSVSRSWHGPESLVDSLDRWQTAAAGAVAAVGLNNLPASMLFASNPPVHARALLIGLNLGPNLAVTGSLSAFLWLRVARSLGARPSARTYSLLGLVLVPVSIAARSRRSRSRRLGGRRSRQARVAAGQQEHVRVGLQLVAEHPGAHVAHALGACGRWRGSRTSRGTRRSG